MGVLGTLLSTPARDMEFGQAMVELKYMFAGMDTAEKEWFLFVFRRLILALGRPRDMKVFFVMAAVSLSRVGRGEMVAVLNGINFV